MVREDTAALEERGVAVFWTRAEGFTNAHGQLIHLVCVCVCACVRMCMCVLNV